MNTSIIRVLKLNDPKPWAFEGRTGTSHTAECMLMTADGEVESVGVLSIPKDLVEKVKVGTYTASFSLRANPASRRIEAMLVDVTPLPARAAQQPPQVSPKVA